MNKQSRNHKGRKHPKQRSNLTVNHTMRIWQPDAADLMQSFPDTQIWNPLSEHEPRFGVSNARDNKIYNVCQTSVARGIFTSGTTTFASYAQNFQALGMSNYTSYAAVFDQYRLMQIEVWLKPQPGLFSTVTGTMYTVIDYDDSIALSSELAANAYENVTITTPNEGIYRRFRPHITPLLPNSATPFVSRAVENIQSTWINCVSGDVPHYGFKVFVTATGSVITYDLVIRYWAQFRNPV